MSFSESPSHGLLRSFLGRITSAAWLCPLEASLVAALNPVFDAHTIRFTADLGILPKIVMWMLLFVAAASLSVAGFNAGIQGPMSRWRMTALMLVPTGLMTLIIDFDRPSAGLVVVGQQILNRVIKEMHSDLHGTASTPWLTASTPV